jgi:hypothetical protein
MNLIFPGWRTWLWLAIPTLYAYLWAMYTPPFLFSSLYCSWFFNPHVGYLDDFGRTVSAFCFLGPFRELKPLFSVPQ